MCTLGVKEGPPHCPNQESGVYFHLHVQAHLSRCASRMPLLDPPSLLLGWCHCLGHLAPSGHPVGCSRARSPQHQNGHGGSRHETRLANALFLCYVSTWCFQQCLQNVLCDFAVIAEEFKDFALKHPEYAKLFTTYLELQRCHVHPATEVQDCYTPSTKSTTSEKVFIPRDKVCPQSSEDDSSNVSGKKVDWIFFFYKVIFFSF